MANIPIIFFHTGYSEYMPHTIKQAKETNERVILLGDKSNQHLEVEHYLNGDLIDSDLACFFKHYKHFSTNGQLFEVACFARWFVIKNFLLEHNLDSCVYLDTDIMVYSDLSKELQPFVEKTASFLYPKDQPKNRWAASGHSSYWPREGLVKFCNFINKIYTTEEGINTLEQKWNYHVEADKGGGICDMSLFHLFYNSLEPGEVAILSDVHNDSTFDDNINSSENYYKEEYRMKDGFKEIKWENGMPYGYNLKRNTWIRFNTLHFQGGSGKQLLYNLSTHEKEQK